MREVLKFLERDHGTRDIQTAVEQLQEADPQRLAGFDFRRAGAKSGFLARHACGKPWRWDRCIFPRTG